MIDSACVTPDVSAAARALRAIPSAKRTAAVRRNLARANAARQRKLAKLDQFRAVQLPRFHRPTQRIRATGVSYHPVTMPLRPAFVRAFRWIEASVPGGLTRRDLALLAALHLRPVNLGRFVIEALHHLKRRGLVELVPAGTDSDTGDSFSGREVTPVK